MIGTLLVGGYFAGRFRRPYAEGATEERERRDGAHGLLVWALALVIGVAIAFMAASATVRGAATAAGAGVAAASDDRVAQYVDLMLRPGPQTDGATSDDPRAE